MKNFIFISPNFPENYWRFCAALRERGLRVLGVGDCPYDGLSEQLRCILDEYYYVSSLEHYDEVYGAVAYFAFKYGKPDWLESNNEYWLERDARLREDFNITSGFRPKDMPPVKLKSRMKERYRLAGISVARYCLADSYDTCRDFLREVGHAVVKPDNGVGANATYPISCETDLVTFFSGRHEGYIMEEYIDAKKNILLHQNGLSRSVLNLDNDITASFASLTRGDTLFFSRKQPVESGAYAAPDGTLYLSRNGKKTEVMKESDILIPGKHNVENYLAAMAAVWGIVDPSTMVQVARTFAGVEHRIELVREKDGVKWYNDSIASSPTRTIAGLLSFDRRVILIAGGYDKDIPFDVLGPKIVERVKCLILMGATADKIEAAVKASPGWSSETTPILRVNNMQEAVEAAQNVAKAGDIVTLSPACASFDLYPNFAARGRHFKELVKAL